MSERQILITITEESWDDEDHDWLLERVKNIVSSMLVREDYTIQEFTK